MAWSPWQEYQCGAGQYNGMATMTFTSQERTIKALFHHRSDPLVSARPSFEGPSYMSANVFERCHYNSQHCPASWAWLGGLFQR